MTQTRLNPAVPVDRLPSAAAWSRPIARRDRASAGAYITVLLSPLVVPPRAEVVARVRTLAALGPDARVGRALSGDAWLFEPAGLDDRADRIVVDASDTMLSLEVAPVLRDVMDPDLPFTVFLGATRAALVIDHRLGDGFLAVLLTAAVLGEGGIPQSIAAASDRDPLPPALRTTFGADRAKTVELLRDRFAARRSITAQPVPSPAGGEVPRGAPAPATVAAEMSREATAAFLGWAKGHVPLSVATLHAMREALPRCGVTALDGGSILVDLRRYLPSGMSVLGNFVTGQPVALASTPEETAERLARLLRTGRPLAAHTMGLASQMVRGAGGRLRRHAPSAEDHATGVARLTVSDMGFVRPLDRLPWDAGRGEPAIAVSVDAAGRDGMTVLTHVLRRRLNVSVTFDAAVFDPERVASACRLFCADPLALLDAPSR